jgi:hypothetical protein
MPHVLDDTDIQEHASPATEYNALHERAPALQSSRRGHATLLATLRSMLLPLRPVPSTRAQARLFRTPQEPEMSMDTLARTYPDIYLRITSWAS